MADYSWVGFFKKVSGWLKDYEDRQPELVQILQKVGIDKGLDEKLEDGSRVPLTVIDPFTFFALFMKYGIEKRKQLFAELVKQLQWEIQIPTGFDGVPSAQAMKVWLFPSAPTRSDDMISALWGLFHQAINGEIDGALFDRVLKIPQTGFTKLTQYLLYVAPDSFFPVDAQTKPWLNSIGRDLPDSNWDSYSSLLAWLKTYTDLPFYELSYQAWYKNQIEENTQKFSISTSAQGDGLKKNSELKNNLVLNQILYGPPGTGKTYITKKMAVELADPYWMEQLLGQDSSSVNLQTRDAQIKQRYDELIEEKRIAFITFHQSFAYEDFIEGIRAETSADTDQINYKIEDGVFKTLALLADAQQQSSVILNEALSLEGRRIWKMSLGNTLKGEIEAYDDCIEQGYVGLGWGGAIDFSGCEDRAAVQERYSKSTGKQYDGTSYNVTAVNTFKNIIAKGDLVIVSDGNQKFRAIAEVTGEYEYYSDSKGRYFNQCRPVRWLRVFEPSLPKEVLFKKSLSQMTLYELKPSVVKQDKLKGFLNSDKKSLESPENYVLIIDEINRGNISRIFGELITLLETSKRKGGTDERSVVLPYSKTSFSVPNNLYVLGTMNTADKSLVQLDLALRRRFEFIEMMPQPDTLVDILVYGVNISELLDVLNQRIEVLLDRDHMLGHTYFWPLKNVESDAEREKILASIFEKRIIPLLQEYFFADWERIAWVLNDSQKSVSARFIQLDKVGHPIEHLFPESIAHQVMDRRYRINKEAFTNPESYRGILPKRGE